MAKQAHPTVQAQIHAAGGLLWEEGLMGRRIAIVFRNRYRDWTLPKGKLLPGETWQQAALREVREETGYQAQITGFAGAIAYQVDDELKVVRFWHMVADRGPSAKIDTEVNRVEWLPVREALLRLDYPLERALLEVWAAQEEVET